MDDISVMKEDSNTIKIVKVIEEEIDRMKNE